MRAVAGCRLLARGPALIGLARCAWAGDAGPASLIQVAHPAWPPASSTPAHIFYFKAYSTRGNHVDEAKRIVQAGDAQAFLVRLREIRSAESLMTLQEFLVAYRDSTGTSSEEALQALEALHRAGVVLHMGTRIFLNPGDIVAQLSRVLPSHARLSSERLREAESELEAMEAQRRGLEASSRRMRHLAQWGALAALVLPWAVLFRLTYWELSWDVTEPLGFFFGGLTTILSYLWYMRHQHDFTWSQMHNRMMGAWERRAFERAAFDASRYELLKRRVRAYRELFEAEVEGEGVGHVEE